MLPGRLPVIDHQHVQAAQIRGLCTTFNPLGLDHSPGRPSREKARHLHECFRRTVMAARPPADAPTPTTGNDLRSAAAATFTERLAVVLWEGVDWTLSVDLRPDFFMALPERAFSVLLKLSDFN
jgi:hypothetical protein